MQGMYTGCTLQAEGPGSSCLALKVKDLKQATRNSTEKKDGAWKYTKICQAFGSACFAKAGRMVCKLWFMAHRIVCELSRGGLHSLVKCAKLAGWDCEGG